MVFVMDVDIHIQSFSSHEMMAGELKGRGLQEQRACLPKIRRHVGGCV